MKTALAQPVNDMERTILEDFFSEYKDTLTMSELKEKFEAFKKEWKIRMINYLIGELEIS